MAVRSQPRNQLYEVFLRHCRTACGWPIHAAANMKKNRASRAGYRRIGIMPDLNQPMIREVTRAHFFVRVIVGRVLRIDDDMPIVIR